MKYKQFMSAAIAGVWAAIAVRFSTPDAAAASLHKLTEEAVSNDPAIASPAIASLRAEGPIGLDQLFSAHAALIAQHERIGAAPLPPETQSTWQRLEKALDGVSAQHDCYASHLYWYTDFDKAKAAAKAAGKPILSLRLLGRLDEEYSCANSRFFRTTLYANAELSKYLRDHFILHWKSVRPVPRITIDFGDGRKIERTITGNSIHYVLDADGRPIDALPGLYGPKAFMKGLADAETAALKYSQLNGNERAGYLRQYHSERLAAIQDSLQKDTIAMGQDRANRRDGFHRASDMTSPSALNAAPITASKTAAELPMLATLQSADDMTWRRIANLHADDASLDASSKALIGSKNPTATEAGRVAISKTRAESPLTSMLRNFKRSIAEDTVRNEYNLHSQIHQWFINGIAPQDVEQLNALVYARLFLTPDSDPWLGLVPPNTFTGLDNNGLICTGKPVEKAVFYK